jgi:hypothetical protein
MFCCTLQPVWGERAAPLQSSARLLALSALLVVMQEWDSMYSARLSFCPASRFVDGLALGGQACRWHRLRLQLGPAQVPSTRWLSESLILQGPGVELPLFDEGWLLFLRCC